MVNTENTNRLIHETSPYLLQHAHNPVDWYPWGEEAFNRAKDENKPVFLSIGYSTCHWCHVMERESFEDDGIAELLNRHFISIKADKEERPDVDGVYMQICMSMTGSGGWPLTIIMTPDKKPFFAGTYLPKRTRRRMPGLTELLEKIGESWQTNSSYFTHRADEITSAVQEHLEKSSLRESAATDKIPDITDISDAADILSEKAYRHFAENFDKQNGGFGRAPKFPSPHNLLFLTEYHRVFEENHALDMVEKTLLQMYRGGIFDHIGYGFSRYSTDERWLAPHFEKMLYDNAMLTMAYTKAYSATGRELYKDIAQKIIQYVLRDLTHPEGGFYSAEDADSEGEEGKFYLLGLKEVTECLGPDRGWQFNRIYDITDRGNFEGKNIPNLLKTPASEDEADYSFNAEITETEKNKLREYRQKRYPLHKDDKILASWNGLMIAALAQAHLHLSDATHLLDAAEKAVAFVEKYLMENGEIFTSYRDGRRSHQGFLEDYASMGFAMIEMYRATWNLKYLRKAKSICEKAVQLFFDNEEGGFRLSGTKNEPLILDLKETYDGASPSGNSIMAYNMSMLSKLGAWEQDTHITEKHFGFMAKTSQGHPASHCFFLLAMLTRQYPGRHITCVLSQADTWEDVVAKFPDPASLQKETIISILEKETKNYPLLEGKTTYYTCDFGKCYPPSNGLPQF